MKVEVTKRGVCFTMEHERCEANDAVEQAIKFAKLCGFGPRELQQIGGKRMLAVITRVRGAEYKRQMFAKRLVFELAERGVIAEVVTGRKWQDWVTR